MVGARVLGVEGHVHRLGRDRDLVDLLPGPLEVRPAGRDHAHLRVARSARAPRARGPRRSGSSSVVALPTRSARPKLVFTARSFWSTVKSPSDHVAHEEPGTKPKTNPSKTTVMRPPCLGPPAAGRQLSIGPCAAAPIGTVRNLDLDLDLDLDLWTEMLRASHFPKSIPRNASWDCSLPSTRAEAKDRSTSTTTSTSRSTSRIPPLASSLWGVLLSGWFRRSEPAAADYTALRSSFVPMSWRIAAEA